MSCWLAQVLLKPEPGLMGSIVEVDVVSASRWSVWGKLVPTAFSTPCTAPQAAPSAASPPGAAALFQAADPEPVQAPANVPWVQMQLEQFYQAPQPRLGSCQNVKQLLQLVLRVLHLLRRLTPQPLCQKLRVVSSWPAVLWLSIHTDSSHLPMCLALQKRTGNQGLCG